MSPSDAQLAVYFLSRVAPRGEQEERELVQVIQSLYRLANPSKIAYNGKSTTAA